MDQEVHQTLGILQQRVQSIEAGNTDLRASLSALNTKMDERFGSLSTKLDERSRTPWSNIISACGMTMGIITVVGSLAISPLSRKLAEIGTEYRYPIHAEIVPRAEHLEKWRANEKDIDNVRQRIGVDAANLQRQVDELRTQYNAVYGARDIIMDLKDRLQRLELENAKKS